MKRFLFWGLLFMLLGCTTPKAQKINGLSFVAANEALIPEQVVPVTQMNANWVAIMPFGFMENLAATEIIFDTDRQWFGETAAGAKQYIGLLKEKGIQVMLKPQIWIWRGEFTGKLEMKSEADWKKLEASYSKFILSYAQLAQSENLPLFCIGTELERFMKNRPDYWHGLVKEIRQIYKGKLTYAANWDEYKRCPLWDELDYIGIDAYFPLSEDRSPDLASLKSAWEPRKKTIKQLSDIVGKPVLFTEFGYRSMDFTGAKPWLVDDTDTPVNLGAQARATQALLETFWPESWFAGGFVWKWFIDYKNVGGAQDNWFTPQNKPAEQTLREFYAKY
ncbi:glycoside hydrolase family 113 [Sediminicola luteus]|uniref:Glycoside hydrolase n=1 Tax=Sediminicola luteus TaxID=319238 RepID=A0A2A4GD70_9FLAO|nr:glycoside hydrolase [Sediminicola luteus]PCE65920.1 glycoside hydrolase [Sediminicola luteus]